MFLKSLGFGVSMRAGDLEREAYTTSAKIVVEEFPVDTSAACGQGPEFLGL
jgi:hypothetical protein